MLSGFYQNSPIGEVLIYRCLMSNLRGIILIIQVFYIYYIMLRALNLTEEKQKNYCFMD